jgi:hypothetical protein
MTIKDIIEKKIVRKMNWGKTTTANSNSHVSNMFASRRLYKLNTTYKINLSRDRRWVQAVNEEDYIKYRKEAYGY